ncbi:hypothetical protein RB594_006717 [Gaeumannomyces avenae]
MSRPLPWGELNSIADTDPALLNYITSYFRQRAALRRLGLPYPSLQEGEEVPDLPARGARSTQQPTKMTSTTSTATPVKHSFDARVAAVRFPKSDINAVILDYLTLEGYPMAAANFAKEANIPAQQDDASIMARHEIQNHIHKGSIKAAIEGLNDLDPEEQLGPRAPASKEFTEDLELTMSLLFFSRDNVPPGVRRLLHPDLRREVADSVNKAILAQQSQRCMTAISELLKLRAWTENTARLRKIELPSRLDLGLNCDDGDMADDRLHENGHEPMVTT